MEDQNNSIVPDPLSIVNPNQEDATLEIVKPPKTELRLLHEKCTKCAFLFPWGTRTDYTCITDPECPAQSMDFSSGRNPEKYIKEKSTALAEAFGSDDEKLFMENIRSVIKNKKTRKYFYRIFEKTITEIMGRIQETEDETVSV